MTLEPETPEKRLFGMVTTQNSYLYTHEALRTFFKYTNFKSIDEFLLIDNDGFWSAQNSGSNHPIKVVRNLSPLGFSQNGNYLIDLALEKNVDLYFLNNDLVFTEGWDSALMNSGDRIVCPLSNREVSYASAVKVVAGEAGSRTFVTEMQMNLEQYLGNEFAVQSMAETHRAFANSAFMQVLVMPFFAVKLPLAVMRKVGKFDQDFGQAGGEDYDYSLRAWQLGIETSYALGSWIVHFYGKSSWSGVEKKAERLAREEQIFKHFEKKWGKTLRQIIFEENDKLILELGYKMPENQAEFTNLVRQLSDLRP